MRMRLSSLEVFREKKANIAILRLINRVICAALPHHLWAFAETVHCVNRGLRGEKSFPTVFNTPFLGEWREEGN